MRPSGVSTISFTSPIFSACSTLNVSPVMNIRRAFDGPILATTYGEMVAGMTPRRTSERASHAPRLATTQSHTESRPTPPPIAVPFMRAHVKTGSALKSRSMCAKESADLRLSSSLIAAALSNIFGSPPAQNIGPFPVMKTTRKLGVALMRSTHITSALSAAALMAFFSFGRFNVITATVSFAFHCTSSGSSAQQSVAGAIVSGFSDV
mmetsp:Transcript_19684/g.63989  ORF Transcript_19684/g.63989 Transcript_19684/m.63989 type:complete len:208 (-) Transcript_19684:8-631(-)